MVCASDVQRIMVAVLTERAPCPDFVRLPWPRCSTLVSTHVALDRDCCTDRLRLFDWQSPDGGLLDKPGKARDYYHTCYCLSGLSAAQHILAAHDDVQRGSSNSPELLILGLYNNLLEQAEPLCNVRLDRYQEMVAHFADCPLH